jgi:hypothetical protein
MPSSKLDGATGGVDYRASPPSWSVPRSDIIVTAGSESAVAAKQATSRIPIVTATGGDLQGLGVVESLARPGGNVTGVISLTTELGGSGWSSSSS